MNDRLNRLRNSMAKAGIDAVIVNSITSIRYLSDFTSDEAFVLVTKQRSLLITDYSSVFFDVGIMIVLYAAPLRASFAPGLVKLAPESEQMLLRAFREKFLCLFVVHLLHLVCLLSVLFEYYIINPRVFLV